MRWVPVYVELTVHNHADNGILAPPISMVDTIIAFIAHVLVVMFFTGLIGCAFMIIVSWIEICSDGFTSDE